MRFTRLIPSRNHHTHQIRAWASVSLVCLAMSASQTKSEPVAAVAMPTPKRVILVIIDGMHVDVPQRFAMTNLRELAEQGVWFKSMVLPPPHHPTDDPKYPWSCSLPNPMLMAGTPFVGREGIRDHMIQHHIDGPTAFLANARSYRDVAGGFDQYLSFPHKPDALVTQESLKVIDEHDPILMRVHYQRPGIEGMKSIRDRYRDELWYNDVWQEGSPYQKANVEADRQLGLLVAGLKQRGKWDDTVMLICGDHGQADEGWHEPSKPESSKTPLIIIGPGIRKGQTFAGCTIFDVAPTIAALLSQSEPALNAGRVLQEAWTGNAPAETDKAMFESTQRLNQALLEFMKLDPDRQKQLRDAGFMSLDDVGRWHETPAGTDFESFVEQQVTIMGGAS